MSDGIEKANEALVALAEHYNDSDVIDERFSLVFRIKWKRSRQSFLMTSPQL